MTEKDDKKVKKGPHRQEMPISLELLSAEEKAALTAEAEAAIADQRKAKASTEFFDKELERLRREHTPTARMVNIVIDSAPYVPFFMIDGQQFLNGYEYIVPYYQALVLQEQIQRSWQHQNEIDGRSRHASLRRETNMTIGARHAGTPTRGFDRRTIVAADDL